MVAILNETNETIDGGQSLAENDGTSETQLPVSSPPTSGLDVVFVIEASAHISPYVESLKTNYIAPTLEYFSGLSVEDDDIPSVMLGIVAFMSMDCKPESASVCYAPTSSTQTFHQWLDKIQFIGGAGDSSSNIVEGLATAVNVFDDFSSYRNHVSSKASPVSKYCILICNSLPYQEPVSENQKYFGYSLEQLTSLMAEKNVHLSIFSPRKMSFLYKLFENAGGNLATALAKNYAKDRRHLVLLNGFALQEKPVSPSSQSSSSEHLSQSILPQQQQSTLQEMIKTNPVQGLKRPGSPMGPSQIMQRNQQLNQLLSQDGAHGQQQHGNKLATDAFMARSPSVPSPSTLNKPQTSQQNFMPSPMEYRPTTSPPSSNQTRPMLTIVRPRTSTPQMMIPSSVPSPMPSLVAQSSPQQQQLPRQHLNQQHMQQPSPMNIRGQQQQQQPIQSPFSVPAPSPQPSPMSVRPVPSPANYGFVQSNVEFRGVAASSPPSSQQPGSVPSPSTLVKPPTSQQQQFMVQQQSQMIGQQQQQQQQQQQAQQQQQVQLNLLGMGNTQRARIWSGLIEFQDKTAIQMPGQLAPKISYSLECTVTSNSSQSSDVEFVATNWPSKLSLTTIPKQLINRLSPIFKNDSYHVNLNFHGDPNALTKLEKAMMLNQVGCIQMQTPSNARIIIVFYLQDKKVFIGFIPHNQDEFMNSMKECIELHKKEQQVKQQHQQQKMLTAQMGNSSMYTGGATTGHMQQQQQHQAGPGQMQNFQLQSNSMPSSMSMATVNVSMVNTMASNSGVTSGPGGMSQQQNMQMNQAVMMAQQQQRMASGNANNAPGGGQGNLVATSSAQSMTTGAGYIQQQQQNVRSMTPTVYNHVYDANGPPPQQQQQAQQMLNRGPTPGMMAPNQQLQSQQSLHIMQIGGPPNVNMARMQMAKIKMERNELGEIINDQQQQQSMIAAAGMQQAQQQQQQGNQGGMIGQQQQQNNAVRQHLHQQLQQKQHQINMQQQQQQQQQQNPPNLQLRHLLQTQRVRGQQPQQVVGGNIGGSQQQLQGQLHIIQQQQMQQQQQQQQQQQFRFQNPIGQQQQQLRQQMQQQGNPRANFFDDGMYNN